MKISTDTLGLIQGYIGAIVLFLIGIWMCFMKIPESAQPKNLNPSNP